MLKHRVDGEAPNVQTMRDLLDRDSTTQFQDYSPDEI